MQKEAAEQNTYLDAASGKLPANTIYAADCDLHSKKLAVPSSPVS
jgi:hypothetical protein